ncbi:Rep family protein, partial [Clostridioides difficile]|uniref:Rep family protein n=1 Tax=Clostridioides difficile TaxID=1496 RepID=UPI001A9A4F32
MYKDNLQLDTDMNPDNTPNTCHYHVHLTYSGPTSYNVVKALTDGFHQPIPQALEQVRGYYRYLTHKDHPEKAQYDERESKTINGFNIADFSELTRSERTPIKKTLQALQRQYCIVEHAQLMAFLQDEEMKVDR